MATTAPAKDIWTVREVLEWTTQRFASHSFATPLLDAQLLLASTLKLSKVQLYTNLERPLGLDERAAVRTLVQRRLAGEPVAYILKQKAWHDLDLLVDERVLIPRPETETLLDFCLALWRDSGRRPGLIVDLCTGSGCLAIALARAFPDARIVAVDLSRDALDVAESNRVRNGAGPIEFILADVTMAETLRTLKSKWGAASIVTVNPPYVSDEEWNACEPSVRNFEPRVALVAGDNGMAIGKAVLRSMGQVGMLESDSVFAMELGVQHPSRILAEAKSNSCLTFSQQHPLSELPRNSYFALRDLALQERFLCHISGLALRAFDETGDLGTNVDETRSPLLD